MKIQHDGEKWTSIIKPKSGWFDINIRDLLHYRDLIILFVRRDFISVYKQTILGPLWFLLQPLFTTVVYTIIFGMVAKIPTDGIPHVLFYMSGIVCWNYFSACLTKTSETFIANAGIFGKVYFPRLAIPVSVVITNLILFSVQFLLFFFIFGYFYINTAQVRPNYYILLIPFLLLEMAALGLGIGVLISSLTTKYRDLSYLVGFGVQLWMYGTPVVYPTSIIPAQWKWVYVINPMAPIVETFRYAFIGAGSVNYQHLLISVGITIGILFVGIILFNRIEKSFMDTV
ncbi:MAG TPA: ABC transporter permease [Spirochaetota bacterium]|nr:ABC transporter permease [Spirochaetota bacterium]